MSAEQQPLGGLSGGRRDTVSAPWTQVSAARSLTDSEREHRPLSPDICGRAELSQRRLHAPVWAFVAADHDGFVCVARLSCTPRWCTACQRHAECCTHDDAGVSNDVSNRSRNLDS
jgi:hypothetical protein